MKGTWEFLTWDVILVFYVVDDVIQNTTRSIYSAMCSADLMGFSYLVMKRNQF